MGRRGAKFMFLPDWMASVQYLEFMFAKYREIQIALLIV